MKLGSRQRWLMQSIALLSLITVKPAWTQVVSDGSTGTVVVGGGVGCFPVCDITGGTSVGSNLFHSFEQFSVLGLGAARFFNNDPNIQTVISRVTGGDQSIIAGQLLPGGAFPGFDLVLINPSGITFRQGADISQLQGSFIASTANSVIFPGGVEFSATSTPPPLLAINVPLGLQYGANSQPITVEASTNLTQGLPLGLPNTTLALVGSGLEVREFSRLTVRSSRMELGSVGANSFIGLVPDPSGWRLDYSAVQDNDYRDISMGELAVGTALGGDISVRGRTVTLQDGAVLSVRPLQPPFPARDGGILNVYGSLSVQVLGGFNDPLVGFVPTRLTAENLTDNQGSGWIQITTSSLEVQNGGRILSSTSGNAAGGTITIDAVELELSSPQGSPFSSIASQAFGANRLGTGGNITINVDRTTIQGNAFISTSTGTLNRAGDLTITSGEFIKLIGYDNAPSTGLDAESRGEGNAGNITLTTNELIVQDYAQVTVGSQQGGYAGDLTVNAAKITMTNRGLLFGETNRTTGGNILLLPNLAIFPTLAIDMNNSRVSTTANNAGLGGTITIADGSLVSLDANSRITSEAGGTATAGGIAISADTLKLRANSETSVSATGSGDAGNVEITARLVDLKASQITGTTVTGIGGNITIKDFDNLSLDFDNLSLDAASRVSTQTDSGQAGQISITGRLVGVNPVATVSLDGASTISSEAVGNGNAGDIAIQTIATLTVQNNSNQNNSKITTSVVNGTGGTIALDAAQQVNLTNSQITSAATGNNGTAGEIQVTTPQLTATDAQVTVSAAGNSRAGDVTVIASQANFDRSSITADTESGSGGNIILESLKFFPRLQVALINDSEISTRATVAGQSGFIFIPDGFSVFLDNSRITSESNGNAFAGDIVINTRFFTLNNSQTSVSALGVGNAGNVAVRADEVALNRSSVTATTRVGAGGNISFRNLDNFRAFNSQISAETITGRAGNVLLEGDLIINGAFAATVRLDASSTISSAALFDTGNAGSVTIRNIGNLTVQNNSQVTTSVVDGTGGTIAITANDEVDLKAGSTIASQATGTGNAGEITIDTANLSSDNSTVSTSVVDGTGGTIAITANNTVGLNRSTIASQATGTGDAGAVTIATGTLSSDKSTVTTSVVSGTGGTIAATATTAIVLTTNSRFTSEATGNSGTAGTIQMTTPTLQITDSQATVRGLGNSTAGNVQVFANQTTLDGGTVSATTVAGSGGNITLSGQNGQPSTSLTATNTSVISASTQDGQGGSVAVQARQFILLDQDSRLEALASGDQGRPGDVTLTSDRLTIQNNARASVSAVGIQDAGNFTITAAQVQLDNGGQLIAETAAGTGGNIDFQGLQTLTLNNNSTISTSTQDGQGGNLPITATTAISLGNQSQITAEATGRGSGGIVSLAAPGVTLQDGAAITTTAVDGAGGSIRVNAPQSLQLARAARITTEASGNGSAGDIQLLTTAPFNPVDGVQITVSNTGTGNAGNLTIAAPVIKIDRNTRLQAITNSGQGGTISFPGVTEFTLDNNSVISTETKDGQGGAILVNAPNQLNLNNGSKITSSATGNGNSGDIRLTTNNPLTIANGSRVIVNSEGTGQGGTIFITANALSMTNNTLIGATTESGKGGNINIQVADSILLRFNSDILTEARGAGDGGNMVLQAGTFIGAILSEDSDIIAGAVTGMGGRIDATALLTFGFRLYSGLNTPESDFTASSQFGINGEVNLNTQTNPAPEPLPDGFAPPSIANTCSVNPAQRSSYRQMGSGGISPLPGNALTPNTVRVNLVSPVPANSAASQALSSQTISPPAVEVTNPAPPLDRIVEAQGWIRLADGTIVLTANPALLTAYRTGLPILTCGG